MKIKRGFLIFIIIAFFAVVFISQNIFAEENTTSATGTKVDKAYKCLQDLIGNDCTKLTIAEQEAVVLTLGNYKNCKDALIANSKDGECWPKAGCKLQDTAMATLAFDRMEMNTDKSRNWLLNQTKISSELVWYLQIDSEGATECSATYSGSSGKVNIADDKRIVSSTANCLQLASSESEYWLKISPGCFEKEFTISCNKDFTTTLLYKTQSSSTIHVSSNINSAVANGQTTEKIIYKCFKQGTVCDYEGSLWAAFALKTLEEDISEYLPYLYAFQDENKKYFPEAFLYIMTGSDDSLNSIIQDNFKTNMWQAGAYNKYYSTALAFMALQGQNPSQIDVAKEYLLSDKVQGEKGCWNNNNIHDTAMLLYSGWPLQLTTGTEETGCTGDADCATGEECTNGVCVIKSVEEDCEAKGNFCLTDIQCQSTTNGITLKEFKGCLSYQVCCSDSLKTCSEQLRKICDANEECTGTIVSSSDFGTCCDGTCETKIIPPPVESTCGKNGNKGICKSECSSDDTEEYILTCDSNAQKCCVAPTGSTLWIWILLILILLVILGIVFRNKLRLILFKFKGGFKKGPAPAQTRPGYPPYPPRMMSPTPPRQLRPMPYRPMPPRAQQPISSPKDKEFDETLRKLREMSK